MKRRLYLWIMMVLAVASGCGDARWNTGDRVLVSKCQYESGLFAPRRYDVVVFKFPDEPIKRGSPYNYIKRLMGLPGEILAILFGRIYVFTPDAETPLPESHKSDPKAGDVRKDVHSDHPDAQDLFLAGKFKIARKPLDVMLAMRRPVFLNNHQPTDIRNVKPRWNPAEKSAWKITEDRKTVFTDSDTKDVDWIRYQHLVAYRIQDGQKVRMFEKLGAPPGREELNNLPRSTVPLDPAAIRPQLISDEMSYNSNLPLPIGNVVTQGHWVSDLMLECKVKVTQSQGEFWMELSKGIHRYRARFNLADGECELFQVRGTESKSLGKKTTAMKGAGTYSLRFANIDARLTVWVNGKLPFDDGIGYDPDEAPTPEEAKKFLETKNRTELVLALQDRRGPTKNDLEPASLGVKGGAVEVTDISLWRDTFYASNTEPIMSDRFHPEKCEAIRSQMPGTFYVPPGHYFCLGDNSPSSADGRSWGTVPQRLMLGRALMIYWPLNRIGTIR